MSHTPQVFQSELVVREFDDIMGQLRQLSMMASRFPDFDLSGKEMFLDKVLLNVELLFYFSFSAAPLPAQAANVVLLPSI
jgi:hypothetical protein